MPRPGKSARRVACPTCHAEEKRPCVSTRVHARSYRRLVHPARLKAAAPTTD